MPLTLLPKYDERVPVPGSLPSTMIHGQLWVVCTLCLALGFCSCLVLTDRPVDFLPWPLSGTLATAQALVTLARDPLGLGALLESIGIPTKTVANWSLLSIGMGTMAIIARAGGMRVPEVFLALAGTPSWPQLHLQGGRTAHVHSQALLPGHMISPLRQVLPYPSQPGEDGLRQP